MTSRRENNEQTKMLKSNDYFKYKMINFNVIDKIKML